jgi:hypothetical protein
MYNTVSGINPPMSSPSRNRHAKYPDLFVRPAWAADTRDHAVMMNGIHLSGPIFLEIRPDGSSAARKERRKIVWPVLKSFVSMPNSVRRSSEIAVRCQLRDYKLVFCISGYDIPLLMLRRLRSSAANMSQHKSMILKSTCDEFSNGDDQGKMELHEPCASVSSPLPEPTSHSGQNDGGIHIAHSRKRRANTLRLWDLRIRGRLRHALDRWKRLTMSHLDSALYC